MKHVVVSQFGGPERLHLVDEPTPQPGDGMVRIKLTSVGLNHADLMARRGEYRLISGDPPFTPGLEGGGVIDALGPNVTNRHIGQRVILTVDATRNTDGGCGGTYRTHCIAAAHLTLPAPEAIPDDQLGALWLAYLTPWGCLSWKQNLQPGQCVAIGAASSSVGLAAAQVVRKLGGVAIGLTSSPGKLDGLRQWPHAAFDHLIATHDDQRRMLPWRKQIKAITNGHGVDAFFDPVAAGAYLQEEILALADHGTIWVYGLLGTPGNVDVTPLIRKHAAIRGWVNNQIIDAGQFIMDQLSRQLLDGFASGAFNQHLGRAFPFDQVRQAHEFMEKGGHIGKLVLIP